MSTVLTQQAPTPGHLTFSLRGSMSTTTRPLPARTCPGPCSWTLSPAPWTASGPGPLVRSSDQTTLCSDSQERATTGPRGTTLRVYHRNRFNSRFVLNILEHYSYNIVFQVLSLLILSLMLSGRKQRTQIVSKGSR